MRIAKLAVIVLSVPVIAGLSGCGTAKSRRVAAPNEKLLLDTNEKLLLDAKARLAAMEATLASVKAATATKVDGTLHSDGVDFPIDHCSSGQLGGFSGIELTSGSRKIRIVSEVDGKTTVIYFPDLDGEGVVMRDCAHISLSATGASFNFVTVVTGTANVDCRAPYLHLDGALSFQCSR
jgi:hypothetical protein